MSLGTGLKRLQGLSRDFSAIEDQVPRIRDVLGISSRGAGPVLSNDSPLLVNWEYQGHTEFALRWLLGQLQTSTEAKQFPQSWHLLTTLVLSLPSAISSRSLASANLIKIVYDALRLVVHAQDVVEDSPSHAQLTDVIASEDRVNTGREDKKAHHEGEDTTKSPPPPFTNKERLILDCDLLVAIVGGLDQMSRPQKRERQGNIKLRTLVPLLAVEESSKLLGIWLQALNSVMQHNNSSEYVKSKVFLAFAMRPVLRIWEASVTNSHDKQLVNVLFSENCLCSTLAVLSKVNDSCTADENFFNQLGISSVEKLLLEHVFAPARRSFNEASPQSSRRAHMFQELLKPISATLHKCAPILISSIETIPTLFSTAARHALPPFSTSQGRLSEMSWLEAVFTTSCNCLGFDVIDGTILYDEPERFDNLRSLLTLAQQYDISLSPVLLRTIASNFCNIRTIKTPVWDILATILALNNQAFIDHPIMDELVLVLASKSPSASDQWVAAPSDDTTEIYNVIKRGIIIPLMRAHATTRKLQNFIVAWRASLAHRDLEANLSNGILAPTVWEDFDLQETLAGLLDSSLITKQVVELVLKFGDSLSITQLEVDARQQCFASASIIQAIIYASQSEESRRALLPISKTLFEKSMQLIFSDLVRSSTLLKEIWRLAGSTFQLWTSLADLTDILDSSLVGAREPALATCCNTFCTERDNVEALACLSSMLENLGSRCIQCKNLEAGVMSALHCYISSPKLSGADEYMFLATIKQYPGILRLCRRKGSKAVVSEQGVIQHLITSVLTHGFQAVAKDAAPLVADPKRVADFLGIWLSFAKGADAAQCKLIIKAISESTGNQDNLANVPDTPHSRSGILATLTYLQWKPSSLPKEPRLSIPWPGSVQHSLTGPNSFSQDGLDIRGVLEKIKSKEASLHYWAVLFSILRGTKSIQQAQFDQIVLTIYYISFKDASKPDTIVSEPGHLRPKTQNIERFRMYNGLTDLTYILLTRHRKGFRERHHILMTLLQSLLRCLFVARSAATDANIPDFALQQPNWLTTNPRTNPLQVRHAERFTRLVTTVCDPALSTVQRRRKAGNLSNPAKTARRYAGQYVPYLMLSLCVYQLEGVFAEDGMREALRPGVFAMFDAMGREVQETVHNDWEMSGAVRTLFRTWWEEWKRERQSTVT